MKKNIFVIILINLFFWCCTSAQENKAQGRFFDKIEIKKSFENKIDKEKPAFASFTIPAGTDNYFTINGGLAYRISKLKTGNSPSKTKLDIFTVYNRNTQLKKEQNNFKAGFSLEKNILFVNTNQIPRNFMLWINWSNEYIRDKTDSTRSLASLLYASPYFSISDKIKIGKPVRSKKGNVISYFKIVPGLEYQNKTVAPSATGTGALTRFYFSSSYEWYLRWREKQGDQNSDWVNLFELSADYTYRNDFMNNTKAKEGYLPLFNFNAAFYPFRKNNVSFGATYQNGSDPINGIDNQEFWMFIFKVKKNLN